MENTPHRLTAVWFADLVGYSRLSSRDEAAALALVRRFQEAARGTADRYGGRIVKFLGDGALAEFSSTDSAVRAAVDLQRRLAVDEGAGTVRVGVHLGDVAAPPDGDIYGEGVNVASRLQAEAAPGQVVVSEDVYRQLRPRREFAFEPLGARTLRGRDDPLELFAVEVELAELAVEPSVAAAPAAEPGDGDAGPAWKRPALLAPAAAVALAAVIALAVLGGDRGGTTGPAAASAAAAPAVAVLPFRTTGPGLEMWREGIVDLLAANLDGAAGLRAIDPRTTLVRWNAAGERTKPQDLDTALEVARSTGARYAILGSVAALGPEVRLVAEIYDVESGDVLGHPRVEGAPDSVYALIDRFSMEVLETLFEGRAADLPRVDLARITTGSLPALREFLEGEVLYRRSDFAGAIPPYQRAVAADSTFALALLRLSICHGWLEGLFDNDPALRYVEQAARFSGRLAERERLLVLGHLSLARGELDALEDLQEGVRKYPDDLELWSSLGETYSHLGGAALVDRETHDEAYERAIQLDPSFAPAYIHLIESKFAVADSAAVADLVDRYDRVAGDAFRSHLRRFEIARALAWGAPDDRARARAAFDSLGEDAMGATTLLAHPRFVDLGGELVTAVYERDPGPFPLAAVMMAARRGQAHRALEILAAPSTRPEFRAVVGWSLLAVELPVARGRVEGWLVAMPAPPDSGRIPVHAFIAGTMAADDGRWDAFEREGARLRRVHRQLLSSGDSTGARFAAGAASGLEGYGRWRRGDAEGAIPLLETARVQATGHGPYADINDAIRVWLGEIFLETDRPRQAVEHLARFAPNAAGGVQVMDFLGLAYEGLGEREEARQAYELFLLATEDADPALQPRIEAARQGLLRLGFGRRG